MSFIWALIRLTLFMLSSFGYWEYIRSHTGIHKYFAPAITVCFQITFMFFAGLLNVMPAAATLLFAGGIALLLYSLIKEKLGFIKEYLGLGFLFLIIGTIILGIALRGQVFTRYDNFSHWALVVKTVMK